jgi:hypothetical protein
MKNLKCQHGDSEKDKERPAKKLMDTHPRKIASTITVVPNRRKTRQSSINITPVSEGTERVGTRG